jgi:hypothetical protein
MTQLKQYAFEMLRNISDEKIIYVIQFLESIDEDSKIESLPGQSSEDAFDSILSIIKNNKKSKKINFNDKEEWHKHLEEKYGNTVRY